MIEKTLSDTTVSPVKAIGLSSAPSDGTHQTVYSVLPLYNFSNSSQCSPCMLKPRNFQLNGLITYSDNTNTVLLLKKIIIEFSLLAKCLSMKQFAARKIQPYYEQIQKYC